VSAVLHADVRYDDSGVLLRYPGHDVARRYHVEQRPQPSDRERIDLIEAEREFLALTVIAECLDISDHGRSRVYVALATIQRALALKRRNVGMVKAEETQ
jgi:hypothetical protein